MMKVCKTCAKELPATAEFFSRSERGVHGFKAHCRACMAQKQSARYHADKEAGREVVRRWRERQSNPQLKKAFEAERGQKPTSRLCRSCGVTKPLTEENYNRRSCDVTGYDHRCIPCSIAYHAQWHQKNKGRVRQYQARSSNKRRADPRRRLSIRVSSSIRYAIGSQKTGKRWETLVGYTLDDLKRHIERQFTKGMSWDNIGDWHIDHIVPVKSFKFSSVHDPDFKACWALTNLRPLWAKDNLTKHAKSLFLI